MKIYSDHFYKSIYATDASAYREIPVAVAFPENENDLIQLIQQAKNDKTSLIPRGAGTSLAGQVVGSGIVVDISKTMTKILEINTKDKWVRVQPGVILSELNRYLFQHGLFFGPETSTANRVTLGGMVGNNACGLHSLVYGSTRDHLLEVKVVLSDGSKVVFGELSKQQFEQKLKLKSLEGDIYRKFYEVLSNDENLNLINENYPSKNLKRRNTGYALDFIANTEIFSKSDKKINLSKLIAGSEGTLAFIYEIKLNIVPLPPKNKALVCVHFNKLQQAFYANLIALKYNPSAVELMDKKILDLTKDNTEQRKNRFFVQDEPEAILIVEFNSDSKDEILEKVEQMEQQMRDNSLGYAFPVIWENNIKKVWDLRRAGLGVLSNIPGDERPVSLVEDTAVDVNVLPQYLEEFDEIMQKYNLSCVYHAHIGSGELHLRPLLNLKKSSDVELFHTIGYEVAKLVKKYNGSLSGEHGDGRLRGEFIPLMYGDKIYDFFKQIKQTFDPENVFNPGKIVDTPPMNSSLRFVAEKETPKIKTLFDFSNTGGFLRAAEKCNGSGDCRKTENAGGAMCPSFQATKNEWNSTRARANILREFITYGTKTNSLNYKEIYDVLDTCLSCKACKSECPSNVDITKLKAEFLQHYYDQNGVSLRSRMIANFPILNKLMAIMPNFSSWILNTSFSKVFTSKIGFAKEREIPAVKKSLNKRYKKLNDYKNYKQKVYLFNDEFTNLNDPDIGIKAIILLNKLGYEVIIPKHIESGRTYLSKGFVRKAKKVINQNIVYLKDIVSDKTPIIGIEPSAILTFRDESIDLAYPELKPDAEKIAKNSLLFDEFLSNEIDAGNIKSEQFTTEAKKIKFHGHCYQKALASTDVTKKILSLPKNYVVEEIKSGCCGMAGSFGYEKEHYELSMKVGELVLFPAVRNSGVDEEIVALGTSCRHHIKHGTDKNAKHPAEILYEAIL
ncbi:MAG: FAD-binding oxidoreductase [Bacteroidales bacterium]|nr:FAD-binding oxidoreductase [Bacteroidales bacterium]